MSANEMQVGGTHYQGDYQHWDMVVDTRMPYLLGCATKYIARYKKKHGSEDLRKAIHYIDKAVETGTVLERTVLNKRLMTLFILQNIEGGFNSLEAITLKHIYTGDYGLAVHNIKTMISVLDEIAEEKASEGLLELSKEYHGS